MFLLGEKAQAPFATVWSVENKGNYVQGKISTSEKDNREEGKWKNSNWLTRFVGQAKDSALDLKERDRIKILSGKVTNEMYGEGENKKSIPIVIVFNYEILESAGYQNTGSVKVEDDSDDLPF